MQNDLNNEIEFINIDISREDQVKEASKYIMGKYENIDILINNAAKQTENKFFEMSVKEFKEIIDTNLIGNFICSSVFGEKMKEGSKIINMLSVHYNKPRKNKYSYDASKAGIAWAETDEEIEKIFIGSEAGPWICPDNSPEFIKTMKELIQVATKNNKNVSIDAPLNYKDKQEIIKTALDLKVPIEHTWTCVTNGEKPCGICQPCRNRKEAFESMGMNDPAIGTL